MLIIISSSQKCKKATWVYKTIILIFQNNPQKNNNPHNNLINHNHIYIKDGNHHNQITVSLIRISLKIVNHSNFGNKFIKLTANNMRIESEKNYKHLIVYKILH
jgi:hypothetical protein